MKYTDIKSINNVKLINKYIPFITKVAECKNLVEITSHKTIAKKKIFSVDSTTRHLFYVMKLIQLYTDVEFEDDELIDAYDELNKKQILYSILDELIPDSELTEFKNIMEMTINDLYENERSTSAIFSNLKDAIGLMLGDLKDAVEEATEDNAQVQVNDIDV